MTLHNAGSSADLNIALKREGEKRRHPSTIPTEQGLTLLSGRDMVLSLWYSDSNFFISNGKR